MLSTKPLKFISFAVVLLLGVAAISSAQQRNWQSFGNALATAQEKNKLVVVDIWAPWCGWCHKMKQESYPKLSADVAKQFVFTRLNRDDKHTSYQYKGNRLTAMRLAQKLHAQTVPTVVILSSDGDYLFHISGFLDKEKLQSVLIQTQQLTFQQ